MQAAHVDNILWEFGRRKDDIQVSVQSISKDPDNSVNIMSTAKRECMVNSSQLSNDDRISNTSAHPIPRERGQINEIISSKLLLQRECRRMTGQSQQETIGSVYSLHQYNLAHEIDHSAGSRRGNPSIQPQSAPVRTKDWIVTHIEGIFEEMMDSILSKGTSMSIALRSRRRKTSQNISSASGQYDIKFPGGNMHEAWRFAVLVRILELIHTCLRQNIILTKRDLFYRHPALFGTQDVVDRYVDDLACTFGVSRSSLGVTASARGLIAGSFLIKRLDVTISDGLACRDGLIINGLKHGESIDNTRVTWVLVIEKEATFRSLASSCFWDNICEGGIIITGRGYPDLETRRFLRSICTPTIENGYSQPPVYAIVDFDPDGLCIMSTYKIGSAALTHEDAVKVPYLRWLGLKIEHIVNGQDTHAEEGLLVLTSRDRHKAMCMLQSHSMKNSWRRDLQLMLFLNQKAEIQMVDSVPGGLISLLRRELGLVNEFKTM